MHRLLRCNINTGVHVCARSGCVTPRCHNSPDGKQGYRVWVTSRTRSTRRIWGILKKSAELSSASGEDGWLSLARQSRASGLCGGCRMRCGGRWKSQNRKNMNLSPYVEEPLHSKVIRSSVPELRSRKCFSRFEIPVFYVYIYEQSMSISHIAVSSYVTCPSLLGEYNTPTASLQRGKAPPMSIEHMMLINLMLRLE